MLTRRAPHVIVVASLLALFLALVTPITASASTPSRISGPDRYSTAVEIAHQFSSGVPVVYVATGQNYPDALSAAPAAAAQGGPLLLTPPSALPQNVYLEIQRLAPALIVVVGGEVAVSPGVVDQLSELAPVRRDGGASRYETSRIINERAFTSGAMTAFIATGRNFPDALSASAAAGDISAPVVLVDGMQGAVDGDTLGLLTQLGVTTVKIAGGTAVVSDGIQNSLSGFSVTRLAGGDRYSTSVAINLASFSSESTVYFAVGTGFADALAGAALAGNVGAPLFVVPGNCVPQEVFNAMQSLGVTNHVLLGGTSVLNSDVESLFICGTPPPPPSNPGDAVDCNDFSTHAQAQAWFNEYYPYYGDVAGLDGDDDGVACETLP